MQKFGAKQRAFEERDTLCVDAPHGIHAEPLTLAWKFGSWAWELKHDLDCLGTPVRTLHNMAFRSRRDLPSIDPFVGSMCEGLGLCV